MIRFHPVISQDWLLPLLLIRGNTAVRPSLLKLSLALSTAESRLQRHHVKEPSVCLAPQLTSDAHHAHRSHHADVPDAPGALRPQSRQRAQHGRHAQTSHRQVLHAVVFRYEQLLQYINTV